MQFTQMESNFPRAMFTELRIGIAEYLDNSNPVLFQQYSEAGHATPKIPDEVQRGLDGERSLRRSRRPGEGGAREHRADATGLPRSRARSRARRRA